VIWGGTVDAGAQRRLDIVAAIGLAVGGVFGMAGTFAREAAWRQELWLIDGVALVIAAALLAVKFARQGRDSVAAGFLVFVAGESLLLAGDAAGLEASVPSFGGGVALWSAALVMTSVSPVFPFWARLTGALAAGLFAVTALLIARGEPLLPTTAPLPALGYPFLVATFAGWIWRLLRPAGRSPDGQSPDQVRG
jgi:hypothetical protein